MQSTIEWIDWNEKEPYQEQAFLVIFRHRGTGICHLQFSSIISGPYWYDYEPVYWTPSVQLPEEIIERNRVMTEKAQAAWEKHKNEKL